MLFSSSHDTNSSVLVFFLLKSHFAYSTWEIRYLFKVFYISQYFCKICIHSFINFILSVRRLLMIKSARGQPSPILRSLRISSPVTVSQQFWKRAGLCATVFIKTRALLPVFLISWSQIGVFLIYIIPSRCFFARCLLRSQLGMSFLDSLTGKEGWEEERYQTGAQDKKLKRGSLKLKWVQH